MCESRGESSSVGLGAWHVRSNLADWDSVLEQDSGCFCSEMLQGCAAVLFATGQEKMLVQSVALLGACQLAAFVEDKIFM